MNAIFKPGTANGTITVPPSKSFTHRYLIAASLANGCSNISNILLSDDSVATMDCLSELGAKIDVSGDTATVTGGLSFSDGISLSCCESGSTIRMIMPLCFCGKKIKFLVAHSLSKRPMTVYEKICENQGIEYIKDEESITVNGAMKPGDITIKGNISSQFITGLLFALPLLDGDSRIIIEEPIESRPYIDMTLIVLNDFGITAYWDSSNSIFVPGNQKYISCDVRVEGDWSNGAFFKALNTVGSSVETIGLEDVSIQGDRSIIKCLGGIQRGFPIINITDCPDIGPLLFAVAGSKNGAAFIGTERLRYKESDRLGCMDEELSKMGISMTYREDYVKLNNWNVHTPEVPLSGHGDHRIIMALSLILSVYGGTLTGVEAVRKSYPGFFEDLQSIGINVTLE